jgi:hypothetical protein
VTDYAVNVLYILGFLTSGDGGTEAQKALAMLGLPSATTMEKNTFNKVERAITPAIKTVLLQSILDALITEVEVTMRDDPEFDLDKWRKCLLEQKKMKHVEEYSRVIVAMDMA